MKTKNGKNCVSKESTDTDYFYAMALTMLPGIGCQSARKLLEITESPKAIFDMSDTDLRILFRSSPETISAIKNRTPFPAVEKEMAFIEKNGIKMHYYTDSDFPQRLNRAECIDSPILLYSIGNANLNPERAVSVVGSRKATQRGIELTKKLILGFNQEGITVVSGLALGIDTASHQGALDNKLPTIAVLAHGLNKLYPPQNRQLAKTILMNGGSLLTEIRSDVQITPGFFPARNRIIAALSDATVVVEASKTGGALITANIAYSYHRDLFAFPGRVDDKYSEGCNAIIASCKALLLRNADDLFLQMGWERKSINEGKQMTMFPELNHDEQTIYNLLKAHPNISIDEIRDLCELSMPKIATALLSLELNNCCICLPGKIYKAL